MLLCWTKTSGKGRNIIPVLIFFSFSFFINIFWHIWINNIIYYQHFGILGAADISCVNTSTQVFMVNLLANSCLFLHPVDMEQHYHSFGFTCLATWRISPKVNLCDSAELTASSYLQTLQSKFYAYWKLHLPSFFVKMVHEKLCPCYFNMLTIRVHLLVWDCIETWAGRDFKQRCDNGRLSGWCTFREIAAHTRSNEYPNFR